MDHEALGREISQTGSIRQDEDGWLVQKRYQGSSNRVTATHRGLRCSCQPSRYHDAKCQHIWAVEIYMNNRGEPIILPEQFEEEARHLNAELRERENELVLERTQYRKHVGWFIQVAEDILPVTEWSKTEITTPIEMILNRARVTGTKIYIKIDHTPYDYSNWIGKPRKPLGAERVIALLEEAGFTRIERHGKIELLVFDPTTPVDPYQGIPGREHLEQFIDSVESMLSESLNPSELASFLVDKRELLKHLRDTADKRKP